MDATLRGNTEELVRSLSADSIIQFLLSTGWERSHSSNAYWDVFEGKKDYAGEAIELVLPKRRNATDFHTHLKIVLELLASLRDTSLPTLVEDIKYQDRDLLRMRNLRRGEASSIPLDQAVKQIQKLRSLVTFSICSEIDSRPYFPDPLSRARRLAGKFRFGHTVNGTGFGFSIESTLIRDPVEYQTMVQSVLLDEAEEQVILPPIERRVMERIARGLLATRRAVIHEDVNTLVEAYEGGFNSNMCSAVSDILVHEESPVEYSITWSPRVKPENDVFESSRITVAPAADSYLNDAASQLRALKPDIRMVRGNVVKLISIDAPLSERDFNRSVVIRWSNRPEGEGKPVNVIVKLNKEEYQSAHEAHIRWWAIEVTGVVRKVGGQYRLDNPIRFRLDKS